MRTYEQIISALEGLDAPTRRDQFHIDWLEPTRLAVGRDGSGRYAVLIVGPSLAPRIDVVQANIRTGSWSATSGEVVQGNLLTLRDGPAFMTATATIAAELSRRGIESRPPSEVFLEVEPFVALVLQRLLLPDDYVLGMVGELLVLRDLLSALGDARHMLDDPTALWRGWQHQSRDFALGHVSLEVKTTGLTVSRHAISSLDQVEARATDGEPAESLYLISIGLRLSTGPSGVSIAALADDILRLLSVPGASSFAPMPERAQKFVHRLSDYGPPGFDGYDHLIMRDQAPYSLMFTTTFPPRVYDMADRNVRIMRRADIAADFSFVIPEGLRFTAELPDVVPGSIENPKHDLAVFLRTVASEVAR